MTIEETIKHAEEVAEEQEKLAKRYDDASGYTAKQCIKCADEHRQLAEWLKDYKRLLDQESMLEKIRKEVDFQEKWLMDAGYNAYNVDIAFNSIRSVVKESEE